MADDTETGTTTCPVKKWKTTNDDAADRGQTQHAHGVLERTYST